MPEPTRSMPLCTNTDAQAQYMNKCAFSLSRWRKSSDIQSPPPAKKKISMRQHIANERSVHVYAWTYDRNSQRAHRDHRQIMQAIYMLQSCLRSRTSQNQPWPTSFCQCQVDQRATHLSMVVWFPARVQIIFVTHWLNMCWSPMSLCCYKMDVAKS